MTFPTGIKDVDISILNHLADHDLIKIYYTNKYIFSLFKSKDLWFRRIINKFGSYDSTRCKEIKGLDWYVIYFLYPYYPLDDTKLDLLAKNKDIFAFNFIAKYCDDSYYRKKICEIVIRMGYVDFLEEILKTRYLNRKEVYLISKKLYLPIATLEWLLQNGLEIKQQQLEGAIKNEDVEKTRWLLKHGFTLNSVLNNIRPGYFKERIIDWVKKNVL